MTDNHEDDGARDKSEQRAMWIFSGAIVLLILGGMGAKMLFGHDTSPDSSEVSSQSRAAPN